MPFSPRLTGDQCVPLDESSRCQRCTSEICGSLWFNHVSCAILPVTIQCVQAGTKLTLAVAITPFDPLHQEVLQ